MSGKAHSAIGFEKYAETVAAGSRPRSSGFSHIRKRFVLVSLLLTIAGCATDGYRQFYTPLSGVTPEKVAEIRATPPPSDPQVAHLAGGFDQNAQREYAREGYEVIGYSSFTSGHSQDDDDAVEPDPLGFHAGLTEADRAQVLGGTAAELLGLAMTSATETQP
jgi:hypothetical protein